MKSFALACLMAATSYAVSLEDTQVYVVNLAKDDEDED